MTRDGIWHEWHAPGHLIAQALRAAIDIARRGGLQCEHRRNDPARVEATIVRDSQRFTRDDVAS
jgi:hypothetical protein